MEKQALQKIIDDAIELQKADQETEITRSLTETEAHLTEKDLLLIGEELSIPRKYIQQAIQKYRGAQNMVFIETAPEKVSLMATEHFLMQDKCTVNQYNTIDHNIGVDRKYLRNRTDNSLRLYHKASKYVGMELRFQESPSGGTEVSFINLSERKSRNRTICHSTIVTTLTAIFCYLAGLPLPIAIGVFLYSLLLLAGMNYSFANQLRNVVKNYFENMVLVDQLRVKYDNKTTDSEEA